MSPSTPAKRRPRLPVQPNPFGEYALGSPWDEPPVDVPAINEGPFRAIQLALAQMRQGARGTSILVTGEPGSGKTHLLGRLKKSLTEDDTYVYIRCIAAAATLWRHIRTWLANDLLKREGTAPSRLMNLLQRYPERLDRVASLNLRRVLTSYGEGRHVLAASAWLRGEPLPQSDLDALSIGAERDDEERNRETEAKDAIHGLLSFLAPDPVVLCLDQVEALETYRGDRDGFHAMATVVAELYHEHRHILMVSCLVSAFEHVFEELNNQANVDRWRQNQATLKPIAWDQAVQLIKARLDSSRELVVSRRAHSQDPLWPLNAEELLPLFEPTGLCLPRKLLQACKTQFESLFGDQAAPRPKLSRADFLQQEYGRALTEAWTVVKHQGADKTLGESLPWLLQNEGFNALGHNEKTARYANLSFRGPRGDFGVSLCCTRGNELTGRLRKIERFWTTNPPGLKVVCDRSVTPGQVGQQLLGLIQDRGGRVVYPLPEAVVALQAIHDMISQARSGVLDQDGDGIGEQEVGQWLLDNLSPQLVQLRDDLIERKPSAVDPLIQPLAALLNERKVIEASLAARELGKTPEEVSACALGNPMQFGFLAGPPVVLFEALEGPAAENPRA